MHETGIARDLFEKIKAEAARNSLTKITKIVIKNGEASGILEDLLRHSFKDHIFPGTIAEGAELQIIVENLSAKCSQCGGEITTHNIGLQGCPKCQSKNIDILFGKDVYIDSISGEK
ncbi:MAG: hypothetical protein A3J83_00100 [Elusimicrobia bacterium RIFOXYA2_FULL_40_6]|nr:MAG: hypothetical protein A3J83_00100 [Elusimicrobia bacterium RIFOXYA2_FULL_40_6]